MMAQIRIHDDNEIAICMRHSVHVGTAETEFRGTRTQQDLINTVQLNQLLGDLLCAVGTAIVNDDDLKIAEECNKNNDNSCDVAEMSVAIF